MSRQHTLCRQAALVARAPGPVAARLAGRADISQRHLSFLELGRASPSRRWCCGSRRRSMCRCASTMRCWSPPALRRSGARPSLPRPNLAQIAAPSTTCWRSRSPFPRSRSTGTGTCFKANTGAVRLVEFLVGPLPPGTPVNLADALVAPDVLRPFLVNWADVVRYFIRSVEADAAADGTSETAALLEAAAGL